MGRHGCCSAARTARPFQRRREGAAAGAPSLRRKYDAFSLMTMCIIMNSTVSACVARRAGTWWYLRSYSAWSVRRVQGVRIVARRLESSSPRVAFDQHENRERRKRTGSPSRPRAEHEACDVVVEGLLERPRHGENTHTQMRDAPSENKKI